MKNSVRKNELIQSAHMTILLAYTMLAMGLIMVSILLAWEMWAIPLIIAGIVSSWGLHISQKISEYARSWVYSILMMVTLFFYGIHETSMFDLATVTIAVIMLFSMTREGKLVMIAMVMYYMTMGYDILVMFHTVGYLEDLIISRILLHFFVVFIVGWLARALIQQGDQVLHQAEKGMVELRETTERMDDFLANVSHEIRTPVNAVIGLVAVMLKKEQNPDLKKDMRAVSEAGHRVGRQISDILDHTEIDMEKLVVTRETYMISSVLNDLVQELSGVLNPELELMIHVDVGIPSMLSGDAPKIKKILWHLIDNGIKFTKKGGVYVHLFSVTRSYGINLCMEIKDTGIGMDEQEIERISDNFFQSNSGRSRSVGGLGLGLSIVSGFVQQMGGFWTISSEKGVGTTVTVSIPQKVVDQSRCMSLDMTKQRCAGGYLHFDKYEHPQIREFYNAMIGDLVKNLNVPFYRAESVEGLRKLVNTYQLTHLIVGQEEYYSGAEFIESLTNQMIVAVVAEEDFVPIRRSGMKIIKKPFYCFPMIHVLNMDILQEGSMETEERMYCPGVTALVVDDEPMNLIVAKGIFGNYGMMVETANSGAEAIELCSQKEFDLIFMDHMMPEMDGIEAMHQIRALENVSERRKGFVMIALTANAVSSAREMFLAEGFDAFVPKPIELTDLERVLKRVLPSSAIQYMAVEEEEEEESRNPVILTTPEPEKETDGVQNLEKGGVLMEKGLYYCQGDMEFYRTLLLEYIKEAEGKERDIRTFYEQKDWKNYAIRIHAIKSTSKMIGAEALSELAKSLEDAAKAEDEKRVDRQHEEAMEKYHAVAEAIRQFCGKTDSAESLEEDMDILEFSPENQEEDDVLEFLPNPLDLVTETEEVLEFAPESDGEEVLEFAPENEGEERLEFAPENEGEELLEFTPEGGEE